MRPGLPLRVALVALGALLAAPAQASSCTMTTSQAALQVGDGSGTTLYLVADDCHGNGCTAYAALYVESNLRHGLQRADPLKDDTCGHPTQADWEAV